MRRGARASLLLWLGATACGHVVGDHPGDAASPSDDAPVIDGSMSSVVECKAQRAVYLNSGNGGLAWFTLEWPAPAVITGFQTAYAFDDPANVKDLTTEVAHPLLARKIGARALWESRGSDPQPSVFVSGMNETHTTLPSSNLTSGGIGLPAAGVVVQSSLHPTLAAIAFQPAGPYGSATGAPAVVSVANVDGAVAAFNGALTPTMQQALRPTADQLSRYIPSGALQSEIDLGTKLAFTSNAFRLGVLGTVVSVAFSDDPHGAFANGNAAVTPRANNLASILDTFYTELAAVPEPACGHNGQPLSLADNVVMVITGDTPKNSFINAGWGDGSPGGANWAYVRSNGFTKPGWFGQIQPGVRINFDPTTGAADTGATVAASTAAEFAGVLYAIGRGNKAMVTPFTTAPFDGVILR